MNELEFIAVERNKLSRMVLGNARPIVMAFILFTVVVVMTTDIRLVTISSMKDLGLEFFLLLFASYSMYICCVEGGTKSGLATEPYKEAIRQFENLKKYIEDNMLSRMNEFCIHYIDEEQRKTREQYLSSACIPYDEYIAKYVALDIDDINAMPGLTRFQRQAIINANRVKRIKLDPNKILNDGKSIHSRSALVVSPGTMKNIAFGAKMFKMSFVSICMSLIAFDIILEPSWIVFVEVCLKLATVVINGFSGHSDGYINITVHTVNYINNQSSLMQQAIQYVESNPTTKDIEASNEETSEISLVAWKPIPRPINKSRELH